MPAPTKLTDTEIQKAALLYSQGRTQVQIRDRIGLSQPTICKALDIARDREWLADRPRCTLSTKRVQELEQLIHCSGLKMRLVKEQPTGARHLKQLRILDVGTAPPPSGKIEQYRDYQSRFGRLAAQHLTEEVFPSIASMGVTWGGTLLATIRGMNPGSTVRHRSESSIEFFPVCGAPPDAIVAALRASSNLVGELDERVNGTTENANNFTGVSAALSARYTPAQRETLMHYFRENPGYSRVFGIDGKPGLLHRMDAVMTSVGTIDPKEDPWVLGAAEAAGIEPTILSEHTHGNLGGLFLPREQIGRKNAGTIEAVNRRWTGIKLEDYLSCTRRAQRNGRGGTIVIAFGGKAEVILACIRRGLATQLVIDADLAARLADQLDFHPFKDEKCAQS